VTWASVGKLIDPLIKNFTFSFVEKQKETTIVNTLKVTLAMSNFEFKYKIDSDKVNLVKVSNGGN